MFKTHHSTSSLFHKSET